MKKMFFIITVLLISTLFICSAETTYEIGTAEIDRVPEKYIPQVSFFSDTPDIYEYLRQELLNMTPKIYLSDYYLPVEGVPQYDENGEITGYILYSQTLNTIFSNIIADEPSLFYLDGYGWNYVIINGCVYVNYIVPDYNMTAEEIAAANLVVDEAVNRTLTGITEDMTDIEKALVIHDNICMEYSYSPSGKFIYDIYKMAVNKHGVCQAYTLMYKKALEKVGISSTTVPSPEMNHIWNLVETDGNYYHVDVTWDDPTPDLTGRARHYYFMLDDTTIQAANNERPRAHHSYTALYPAEDNKYADYLWKYSNSRILPVNGEFYMTVYSDGGKLFKYNTDTNTLTLLKLFSDMTWTADGGYYTVCFSGMSRLNDTEFLLNTTDSVLAVNTETKQISEILTFNRPSGAYYHIFGSLYENGNLILEIKNSPNSGADTYKYNLSLSPETLDFNSAAVSAKIPVSEGEDSSGVMTTATYSENNTLKSAETKAIKLNNSFATNTMEANLKNTRSIKTYIWDTLSNLTPLQPYLELEFVK